MTPLEHMARDHDEGPAGSRQVHYLEWTRLVGGAEPRSAGVTEEQFEDWARRTAVELEDSSFSIHFHVWTQEEFLGLILLAGTGSTPRSTSRRPPAGASSSVVVLRKRGDLPEPSPQTPALSRRADSSGASDHRKWLRSRIRSSLSTGDPPPST